MDLPRALGCAAVTIMRYNLVIWDLCADPRPELLTDCWVNSIAEGDGQMLNAPKTARGYLVDWAPSPPIIVRELKFGESRIPPVHGVCLNMQFATLKSGSMKQ